MTSDWFEETMERIVALFSLAVLISLITMLGMFALGMPELALRALNRIVVPVLLVHIMAILFTGGIELIRTFARNEP